MKEYTRTITGVVRTFSSCCDINDLGIERLLADAIGNDRTFAGTISIVVTDLTADTGATAAEPAEAGEEAGT